MSREIAGLTVAQTENSLQEQIAQVFIQILYADESVKINENTLQVSRATYERGHIERPRQLVVFELHRHLRVLVLCRLARFDRAGKRLERFFKRGAAVGRQPAFQYVPQKSPEHLQTGS